MLPDTPTFRELGYDLVMGSRLALAAPKGVPAEILAKWRGCVAQIAADEKFAADASSRSVPLLPMSADETTDFVDQTDAALTAMWAKQPWIPQ
jgi:tripartite-type tricarboxylate transporter receptor subunit TctC